ncbi:hypothetical protein Trydic_g17673 [Trypoxylus dichotomus]
MELMDYRDYMVRSLRTHPLPPKINTRLFRIVPRLLSPADLIEAHKKIAGSLKIASRTLVRGEVLSTRIAEVTVDEQTTKIRTTRRTPQGGVCSPLMWSLVVDELLSRLTAFGVHCIGYADNITMIAKCKFEGILWELIQMSLRISNERCHSVGLSINSVITTIVPSTRKRKIWNIQDIRPDGTLIEYKSEVGNNLRQEISVERAYCTDYE